MANRRVRRQVAAGTVPPTLPPSVEEAYRKKCIELKRRMGEVEQNNDSVRLRKTRLLRGIRKMRLERSLLLHELGKRMRKNGTNGYWDDESEGSSEGPPTPHDKPLRSKRSHRRPAPTPPPLANQFSGPERVNPRIKYHGERVGDQIVFGLHEYGPASQQARSQNGQHQRQPAIFQPSFPPHREPSFAMAPAPNGVSHLPAAPSHPVASPVDDQHPSARSDPVRSPGRLAVFEYFLSCFLENPPAALNGCTQDEIIAEGRRAWEAQDSRTHQDWTLSYRNNWSRNVGYQPSSSHGVVRPSGSGVGLDEDDGDDDGEEGERGRRGYEEWDREDEEVADAEEGAAASGGFTAVNG